MVSSYDRTVTEINARLDALAEAGEPWTASWIAHAICGDHRAALAVDDEDSDFWIWNGYQHVRKLVREQINKRAGDSADKQDRQQFVLHGFERDHLQDYYVVERDGSEVGVPVTQLTDDEIDAKIAEKRAMGAACYAHADELQRFKHWRVEASRLSA
jgi:hypothetical protein